MTLQQLRYFLAALEHGSFSAAADALFLSQPSVSEQVRKLEDELGAKLFERVGRGLVPTEAAAALRPHAEETLAGAEAARESVAQIRELRGGVAAFGAWSNAHYYGSAEILATFRARHPAVRLRLTGQNSAEVAEDVRSGALELGMVALPVDDSGLEVRPIFRDEVLYASVDPARLRGRITIDRVAAGPLILYDASWGREDPIRRQLGELAQRAGVALEPVIDVEAEVEALDLAGLGLGDTVMSRGVLMSLGDRVPRTLGWAPFAEPIHDTFAFVSRRGSRLSPAAREFVLVADACLTAFAQRLEVAPARRREPTALQIAGRQIRG